MATLDAELAWVLAGVVLLLLVATAVGLILRRRVQDESARATIANLNARIGAWWGMVAVFTAAVAVGTVTSIVLFALLSFLALREFLTLTPTSRGDHGVLLVSFFVFAPLQYLLVGIEWYGMFAILIPVYAFVLIPTHMAMSGETERFLARTATVQWGLMACVYCVSYAPALLTLHIPGYSGAAKLLFFLVAVVQISDVLQYLFGKLFGRRPIAPKVSPAKTWEGFLGGVGGAVLVGAALWWITPFAPLEAAAMALVVTLAGFAGGLTMSAIKRDRGVKDFGAALPGHGGILDRIDSLLFAAPVFFHLTRFFYAT